MSDLEVIFYLTQLFNVIMEKLTNSKASSMIDVDDATRALSSLFPLSLLRSLFSYLFRTKPALVNLYAGCRQTKQSMTSVRARCDVFPKLFWRAITLPDEFSIRSLGAAHMQIQLASTDPF